MSKITIRCIVCGRETTLNNVQPGRKIFCLHCGHKITDCYQQGEEFGQTSESSSSSEGNEVPPPINNSYAYVQQENASEPPRPSWMTEPYIRVNWKRIGYTIKTVFRGIGSFFSKRWTAFREGLHSDAALTETLQQPEEQQNVPPMPDVTSQPQVQEPETQFGYVDRRQARMQQSFSRNFSDSGAIPVPPSNPNYSQQRIDNSFSNSFAESGAIPASPSNSNYSQQRIDQSFTNSFNNSGAIPVPPPSQNYSQQRIDQSFTNSFNDSGAIPTPASNINYSQQRIDQSFTKSFQENENKQA